MTAAMSAIDLTAAAPSTVANFRSMFTRLSLAEKARMVDYAHSNGYTIPPIEAEVEGIKREKIKVIPAAELKREWFPGFNEGAFESLQRYYAVAEQHETYPPHGYSPSVTSREREAAALFGYMVASLQNRDKPVEALIKELGYPLQPMPTPLARSSAVTRRVVDRLKVALTFQ